MTLAGTLSILFADLRGYTAFVEKHGDAAGAALITEYRRLVRAELAKAGGGEMNTAGDSFYIVFPTARQALQAEVLQALRGRLLKGQLTLPRSREALQDFADLAVTRYPHLPLVDRIWQLRENASIFDAVYIALAEALDASLVTADAALARVPGVRARVEIFA